MWLMLSEKALCKQILWLKPIIICQLQHTMQWGTSVPHFCHLSHITMACVTHSQICKGWEAWLWSWEYECIAGNLFMKRDYEKKEKNAAQWEQISRMNQLHRHRWGWMTLGKDIWVIMDHKWWEKTKPQKRHIPCCAASVSLPCKTRDCSLKKEDVDKPGRVQRKATTTLNMNCYKGVNNLKIRNAYTGE